MESLPQSPLCPNCARDIMSSIQCDGRRLTVCYNCCAPVDVTGEVAIIAYGLTSDDITKLYGKDSEHQKLHEDKHEQDH